ncbi:MAG: ABC transporter permease, partial [Gammaproteobacteria bacterium]
MSLHTGVADNQLVWASSTGIDDSATPTSEASRNAADLAALRSMPGVKSAVMINSLPLTNRSWKSCVRLQPGDDDKQSICNIAFYTGTSGVVDTLGLKLVQGRDFLPQEYVDYSPFSDTPAPSAVIITAAMAKRMWPGEDPLGKPIFLGDKGKFVTHVVGVTEHMLNPSITGKYNHTELNLLFPVTSINGGMYVLRTTPGGRDAVQRDLPKVLDRVDDQRIITDNHSYAQTVKDYFHNDRALIWLLLVVIGALLALTALGVVGLSSFWVQQRTHQIGIRRAIGATRGDIVRYFLTENFLIVSLGIALGSSSAVGLNLWLMQHYELPHLPWSYLPAGALILWLIGQLAVLGPALRAASVSPATATRNV